MIILSIDIGIKNFAYCLLDSNSNNLKILQWNVINLFGEPPVCQSTLVHKKTKKLTEDKTYNSKIIQF